MPNHLARMCLTKAPGNQQQRKGPNKQPKQPIDQVKTEGDEDPPSSSDEDEFLFMLGDGQGNQKVPETIVNVNGVPVRMTIDTGASTSIVDDASFAKVTQNQPIELRPTSTRIFSYGPQSQLYQCMASLRRLLPMQHCRGVGHASAYHQGY